MDNILNLNNINNSKDDINYIEKIKVNINNDMFMSQIKKEILIPQTPQINKEIFMPEINNEKVENKTKKIIDKKTDNLIENKIENKENTNSEIQDFINKNKEEDKNRINFLKEYKEILDKYGNNLNENQTENKNK